LGETSANGNRVGDLSDERFNRGLVVAVIRPVGDGIAAAEEAS
jgi:hypothetical protein